MVSPYYVSEMAGTRGENQDICGHIVSGTSTHPAPLSTSNHCVLAYSIVRKSPKRVAPYYEAPIRHESCQTTCPTATLSGNTLLRCDTTHKAKNSLNTLYNNDLDEKNLSSDLRQTFVASAANLPDKAQEGAPGVFAFMPCSA